MATAVEPTSPVEAPSDPRSPKTPGENELPLPPVPSLMNGADGAIGPAERERVQHVLSSDVGMTTLLGRLKQSISSTRDFAAFLKERSVIEEKHAHGLKRLCRSTNEQIRRPENRQGSFAQNYEEITRIHDRMAEHGLQFVTALYAMSEELSELATNTERGRKHWKQSGLSAERRFQDAESAMDKAKSKYNSLAEQYDRARTGEKQSGRFGLKGTKSAVQQEEDLHRKLEAADSDYAAKVQAAQSIQQELLTTLRPQTVHALQELVREIDAGLGVQMQKFAGLTEKLILGYGLCITPLKGQSPASGSTTRSLREVTSSVNNERDLVDYVLSFTGRAAARPREIKYEKHPALSPKQQQFSPPYSQPPADSYGQNSGPPHQTRQVSGVTTSQGDGYPASGSQPPYPAAGQGPTSSHPPPRPQPPPQQSNFGPAPSQRSSPPPSVAPQLPQIESFASDQFADQTSGVVSTGATDAHYRAPLAQYNNGSGPQTGPHMDNLRSPSSSIGPTNPMVGPGQQYGQSGPGGTPFDQRSPSSLTPQLSNDRMTFRPPRGSSLEQSSDSSNSVPLRGQPSTVFSQVTVPPPSELEERPTPPAHMQGDRARSYGSEGGLPQSYPPPGSMSGPASNGQMQRLPQGPPDGPLPRLPGSGGSVSSFAPRGPSGQRGGPPVRPVFGVSLEDLFQREGTAVPAIVRECIQAVDLYGLDVEGIYRTSGSAHHIMELRQLFDHDANAVDFRNATSFHNDIASVTTLLKHFLRELPDPLLTATQYHAFIEAAKLDDDIIRRDSIHALVNSLPDPNYATLRALTLHLHRVAQHSDRNKMTMSNLAIVFAPTLMGQHGGAGPGGGPDIADAGWQARVVETILHNTYQIFDDDE
ncbi:hypothetical protein A1O1_05957 [Capronia coronata CBS 617.96]|uniref:Rho-GAP domain-containing protein n=1 Tax=Capronia coronata CBS 617.96 TaxID=1182541 RepID=W9XYH2_9EURO|nr:uncharacterized protein A1O1_05957 [Capronia coronata CBS 617.96]EXJ85592.1 hypothetical protein A1O1_05957 [Capronia coronata CBS 617.96]